MLQASTATLSSQILIAILLGAMQVFAFAPYEQWWVLYPSFVGLFILLRHLQQHGQKVFLISFIFNLSMFIATIHWVYVSMDLFGGMPSFVSASLIVLLCAYLALFPTLALWVSHKLPVHSETIRLFLILPSFWLVMDWVRGWFLTGFPWAYLGYSHADTPLAGYAPILGVQGITLAILLICSAITLLIHKKSAPLPIIIITTLIAIGYGLKQLSFTEKQASINVALVQGNIDQNEKWKKEHLYPSLNKYLSLSAIESDQVPELIIWPESAVAALEIDMQRFLQPLSRELEKQNKSLLTGIINYDIHNDEYYNSIIMLGTLPQGEGYSQLSPNRYQKHQLLPIGEFVPFEELIRPLAPYFNLPMSSFQRGDAVQRNLMTENSTLAPALCYEIAFAELLRQNTQADTGFIVTLSNDAWFGLSIGPDQHLEIARMRAIELERPLLRSTNNGITAIYNSKGKELGRLPSNTAAVLRQEIEPRFGQTPYQRVGQVPLFIFCFVSLFTAFIAVRRKQK